MENPSQITIDSNNPIDSENTHTPNQKDLTNNSSQKLNETENYSYTNSNTKEYIKTYSPSLWLTGC